MDKWVIAHSIGSLFLASVKIEWILTDWRGVPVPFWMVHLIFNDSKEKVKSSLTPLIKAFLARGPGPSTVLPSSSGPHEAE